MTSKERMLCALHHEEPDRVPTGEWQFGREIVEPVLGPHTLMNSWATTHAYWTGKRDEVIHNWKTGLVALARHYQWDAVLVHNVVGEDTPIESPEPLGDNRWRFANGDILKYSQETDRFLIVEKGTAQPATVSGAAQESIGPQEGGQRRTVLRAVSNGAERRSTTQEAKDADLPTDSELEVVRHVVRELGQTHFLFSAPLMGHPRLRFGDATSGGQVEDWVKLYEDPDAFLEQRMKKFTAGHYQAGVANAKREGMNGVAFGWDYGTNTGPMMSPDMFKRYVQPVVAATAAAIHDEGLICMQHACGNNQPLMDMIVEAGVDVYQSIQPEMDIVKMKKRYGKKITLWGGVSSGLLITGTPDEVRAEGRRMLRECKAGGGYVYATSHSVMPMAKHANYEAMLEALKEEGEFRACVGV